MYRIVIQNKYMNTQKIKVKEVIAVNSQGTSIITVGKDGVTEILEFIDSDEQYFNVEYVAMKGDSKFKAFINLPVQVEYFV